MSYLKSLGWTRWAVPVIFGATWLTAAACAAPPPPPPTTYKNPFSAITPPPSVVDGDRDATAVLGPLASAPSPDLDASIRRDDAGAAETATNSRKWRLSSFFNRVKKQVAAHWHPEDPFRRADPTGTVYGRRNRLTVLRVRLNPGGELASLEIEQSSGIALLDDQAIAAFRTAQPFPHPPPDLVADGNIAFRFGFLFQLDAGPKVRMFRYADDADREPVDAGPG